MIEITRDRQAGTVILEMVPEDLLQKKETLRDDAVERTRMVEYCWKTCPGTAHITGLPDSPSHFCDFHVHRSARIDLKVGLCASGAIQSFK